MLDARLICEIKESEEIGDELVREFKKLDCAIEEGTISNSMKFYEYLGSLFIKYNAWERNHRELLVRAHGGTDNV